MGLGDIGPGKGADMEAVFGDGGAFLPDRLPLARIKIGQEIVDRVLARRQRYHLFDSLDPVKTAFVIVDMQNTFCKEGSPAEVPASRDICNEINAFNAELRKLGVKIIWVTHANTGDGKRSDWDNFFNVFVADEVRQRTIESLAPGKEGQRIYDTLEVDPSDLHVIKNRYSALIPGASSLVSKCSRARAASAAARIASA